MSADYLAAESPIIARLRDKVPGLAHVGGWSEGQTILSGTKGTPAGLVLFTGDKIPDSQRYAAVTEQTWCVYVVVREPSTAATQSAARAQAGPLIAQVIGALQGFVPLQGFQECRVAGGVQALYYDGGAAAFRIPFRLIGAMTAVL